MIHGIIAFSLIVVVRPRWVAVAGTDRTAPAGRNGLGIGLEAALEPLRRWTGVDPGDGMGRATGPAARGKRRVGDGC
jgi:hypothetical protein